MKNTIILIMLLLSTVAFGKTKAGCGTERWPVKTLTDSAADSIKMTPKQITVEELMNQKPPQPIPNTLERQPGFEFQMWETHALWLGWKYEADEDFHNVFASPNNPKLTFIGEVPTYTCATAKFAQVFIGLRSQILESGKPHKKGEMLWFDKPIPVIIRGIGFFDKIHGQTGVAPNGVELHPLFFMKVDPNPPKNVPKQADGDPISWGWWAGIG